MISFRFCTAKLLLISCLAASLCSSSVKAQENSLRFQRPGRGDVPASPVTEHKFRSPSKPVSQPVKQVVAEPAPTQTVKKTVAKKAAAQPVGSVAAQPAQKPRVKRDTRVRRAQSEEVELRTDAETWEEPVYMDSVPSQEMQHPHMAMGNSHMPSCQCESCMCEPQCGVCDPGCGMMEPGCGMVDPGCGCAEPSCGVAGCGDCVRPRGPDYWCFPVCLPRLQDFTIWGGVHGFRGPRDFIPAGQSNSNFGFQEGFNLSGRAPLIGFLFPDLNYQLGFQALQSRLSGTLSSPDDRNQHFVTAGLYKRTQSGLQFGVVWDSMSDDLNQEVDLNQVRYEISLKTPRGRELGFWGASSTNNAFVGVDEFETVDQFCGFYRWNFKGGNQARLWGGATGDSEGIIGADVYAPLNDCFSVQTGFNYLIPGADPGPAAVWQESWNIGINLVWHWGRRAREGNCNPYRPLFNVADNGWMFVDRVD